MRNDFAVLILSHGRADRVYTIPTLRKGGYTGKIYIVVDNEDEQQDEYIARYGKENVIVFDKLEAMKHSDTMDNYEKHNIVLYARNSCFEIAKRLGLSSFLELDDDYTAFDFRFEKSGKLAAKHCTDLDRLFEAMLNFLYESDSLVVALSQGGDYIGGLNGKYFAKKLSRKAMNAFFCRVDRPFLFFGSINEDVNMYVTLGSRGEKIFSVTDASLIQKETQANAGGLTDIYLDVGTYVKSFYSVMTMPSCVTVAMMGETHRRMHHNISWVNCVPMILNEKYRKAVSPERVGDHGKKEGTAKEGDCQAGI